MVKKSATPKRRAAKSQPKRKTNTSRSQSAPKNSMQAGGTVIGGDFKMEGGTFVGRDFTNNSVNIQVKLEPVYKAISDRPGTSESERADLKAEVKEVADEIEKGTQADESFVFRRLRNLKRMAPDILEVLLATMANPAGGLGMVAAKIARKMSEDAKSS